MAIYTWPPKDPDEVLDYTHNWASRLEAGETVTGVPEAVVAGDATLVVDETLMADATHQTVWLSGGTVGKTADISLRIDTSMGRTYEEGIKLPIRNHGA